MRKKEKILIVFNATGPTTIDQDYTEQLKTKDWETEANVIKALKNLKNPYDLLGIFDNTGIEHFFWQRLFESDGGTRNGGSEMGDPKMGEPKKGDPKWGAEMGTENVGSKWVT